MKDKILIISNNSLYQRVNNGITLKNIFSKWSEGNLFNVFFNDTTIDSNESNYFQFTISHILHTFFGGRLSSPVASLSSNLAKQEQSLFLKVFFRDILYFFYITFFYRSIKSNINFNPHAVFCMVGPYFFPFFLAKKVAKQHSIGFSFYVTDNYIYSADSGFLKYILGRYVNLVYKYYLPKAKNIFVISELMANEFKVRYGVDCHLLNNPGPSVKFDPKVQPPLKNTIAYFGGLHFGRDITIKAFAEYLLDHYPLFTLHIYTTSDTLKIISLSNIVIHPPVYNNAYLDSLVSHKYTLHVESFESEYFDDIRLSFSTKITEYMQFKRCLISIGPDECASFSFLLNNNLSCHISNMLILKPSSLKLDILNNESVSNDLAVRSYAYWSDNFSHLSIFNRLHYLL
jgi:hypothetical protein